VNSCNQVMMCRHEASVRVRKVLASPESEPVDCISQCWSSDGRFLVAAFGKSVVVYNARAGFEQAAAFTLRYSAASIALVHLPYAERDEGQQSLHFLVVGSSFGAELYQLDLASPTSATSRIPFEVKTPIASVYSDVAVGLVEASSDGQSVAIGSIDGRLFVRDLASLVSNEPETLTAFGTEVLHKLLPSPRITGLAFSPCGTALLAATRKGNVFVFQHQASARAWQWYKPTRHLAGNPKTSGTSSAAASTQTLVTWWTPGVFAVCSRSAPSRVELFDLNSGKLLHSLSFSAAKRRGVDDASAGAHDESTQAFNEWVEEPQVTGICVAPAPRRLICHDTSCNLLAVDWPFLELLTSGQSDMESTR
jgi:WD40 repeat protein